MFGRPAAPPAPAATNQPPAWVGQDAGSPPERTLTRVRMGTSAIVCV